MPNFILSFTNVFVKALLLVEHRPLIYFLYDFMRGINATRFFFECIPNTLKNVTSCWEPDSNVDWHLKIDASVTFDFADVILFQIKAWSAFLR